MACRRPRVSSTKQSRCTTVHSPQASTVVSSCNQGSVRPLVAAALPDSRPAAFTPRPCTSMPTFSATISAHNVWHERIADARCLIDQARLLTLKAAYMMDTVGNKVARAEIAMIKVVAPNVAQQVLDWAIQAHGAAGVSDDFPLAYQWAGNRTLRLADGPDEVHRNAVAKLELAKYAV